MSINKYVPSAEVIAVQELADIDTGAVASRFIIYFSSAPVSVRSITGVIPSEFDKKGPSGMVNSFCAIYSIIYAPSIVTAVLLPSELTVAVTRGLLTARSKNAMVAVLPPEDWPNKTESDTLMDCIKVFVPSMT